MAVPPPSPLAIEKAALRRRLRADRADHVAHLRATGQHDRAITAAAEHAFDHIPPGAIVALYRAFGDEIDPMPLARRLSARGQRLALPHLGAHDGALRFLAWHPEAPLFEGIWGIEQPHPESERLVPGVIITPLVGFDADGGRIGQGKGYYDRAFAALPGARRIGYGWRVQQTDSLPRDPWDVPLHAIATDAAWIAVP